MLQQILSIKNNIMFGLFSIIGNTINRRKPFIQNLPMDLKYAYCMTILVTKIFLIDSKMNKLKILKL